MVVVRRCFPLGEKKALLIDFELRCIAIGANFFDVVMVRISHNLTVQSSPPVAKVLPEGCKLYTWGDHFELK